MARPRLQIHLSTCVALVFVTGGLLWANVATRQGFFHGFSYIAISDHQFDGEVSETCSEYMNEGPPQNVIQWGTGLPFYAPVWR
jgi:hypothetical protein